MQALKTENSTELFARLRPQVLDLRALTPEVEPSLRDSKSVLLRAGYLNLGFLVWACHCLTFRALK